MGKGESDSRGEGMFKAKAKEFLLFAEWPKFHENK